MSWIEEQDWFGLEDCINIYESYDSINLLENKLWTTKDGRVLKIEDMSTKHIVNCIKRIRYLNYAWRREYLDILRNELKKREK